MVYHYKSSFFIFTLLCLGVLVSSCFFPEKFEVKININNDRTYSIVYDGILTFVPAKAAALKGQLTTETEREMKMGEKEIFNDPNFKKSRYIGNGQFMVLYERNGVLNSPVSFFGEQLEIISITPTSDTTVEIKGIKLSKDDYEQLRMLNMKIDGTIKITTNTKVLSHNSKSAPSIFGLFGSYNWQIKSISDTAPYMLLELYTKGTTEYPNKYSNLPDTSKKNNPVVPNGRLGEFRHGTFPSPPLGDFTHVGVDIVAPYGSNIYAFADGQVKDIIDNNDDTNISTLGYMVLIEHPVSLIGQTFYTLYLHMQNPPEVKIGDQVKGGSTIIGKVGDTGIAFGGHTHFEIRYFPERFSTWGNIYGPGDQRTSGYFKQNWGDPIKFFKKYPKGVTLDKKQEVLSEPVYLTMKDGSVFTGIIMPAVARFKTKYGEIEVNIDTITSFNKGVLILNDQSMLTGNFTDQNITIKTLYTKLNLPISEIVTLSTEAATTPRKETSVPTQDEKSPVRGLSRDKAKEILNNLVITKRWCAFPGECPNNSIRIPNVYGFYLEASSAGIEVRRETLLSYLSCLEKKGLVKNLSVKKGRKKGFSGWDSWFETTTTGEPWQLTEIGQKYLSDNLDYSLQVVVDKITGIQFSNEDTVAKVFFDATTKIGDNPFNKCFEDYFDVHSLLNEPYALFELFDDGWRVKTWYVGGVLKGSQQTSTKQLEKKEYGYDKDREYTSMNNPRVSMETNYGTITIELYPQKSPKTVENFLQYARNGFYDDTIFHRVIKGFMIQGGGLDTNMRKKPTRNPIINEADNWLLNLYGTVAIAGSHNNPDSATSQFYINTANNTNIKYTRNKSKAWGYCVFGKVVKGMDVVNTIENLPTITKGGYHNIPANPVIIESVIVENDTQQSNYTTSVNNEKSDISNKVSASVFARNNSNIYHKSNCPKLGTEGLMEFASSQKARKSGGVPCGNCNP